MSDQNISRRRFIRNVAVALPAGAAIGSGHALAQDMPQLTEDDPAAKALRELVTAFTPGIGVGRGRFGRKRER